MIKCTAVITSALFFLSIQSAVATETLPEHYAESVMVFSLSNDGSEEISLRLARFPEKGTATIWMHVATANGAWSLADETFALATEGATPVREDQATFKAVQDDQRVQFVSSDRNKQQMHGRVKADILADATRHPELKKGDTPVALDLEFHSDSSGFRSETNRWEMTGRITGTVNVGGTTVHIDHAGKWHEQTGPRARFAPAFTYFVAEGKGVAMLVVAFAKSLSGYVQLEGEMHAIKSFTIDGHENPLRHFVVVLDNDQEIKGVARVVQAWSVPIEDKRRPGSSVLIESNVGPLLGTLNDWNPDEIKSNP